MLRSGRRTVSCGNAAADSSETLAKRVVVEVVSKPAYKPATNFRLQGSSTRQGDQLSRYKFVVRSFRGRHGAVSPLPVMLGICRTPFLNRPL